MFDGVEFVSLHATIAHVKSESANSGIALTPKPIFMGSTNPIIAEFMFLLPILLFIKIWIEGSKPSTTQ